MEIVNLEDSQGLLEIRTPVSNSHCVCLLCKGRNEIVALVLFLLVVLVVIPLLANVIAMLVDVFAQ
jgi:hypothetical protein